jgi:Ca-activated chloride channel family protein
MTTSYLPLLPDHEVGDGGEEAGAGALATARGNLPLEAIEVTARISGLLARVELAQTFSNPHDEPLEATYVFPLPDRAAVTAFRMRVADRTVEGVLRERQEARDAYERALAEGRRASIAEEERPGVFTMRVGNLLPGERASVQLVMTGPLPWDEGESTFRFPLVVAPRYVPGAPLEGASVGAGTEPDTDAVPDASRITPPVLLPGFPNPVRLSIQVEVDPAGLELAALRSSLHAVAVERRGPVRVVRLGPGERVDRDFVLRLRLAGAALTTALMVAPDQAGPGEGGSFALTLVPPAGAGPGRPRDVAFVLDRSGSMAGWKMVAARRAVARMVDTLTDRDRFAVLAFDNQVEVPPGLGEGLRPAADPARFRAAEFLDRLQARGGTELAGALTAALDRLAGDAGEGRERLLVLVTDGQVGNEDQLLRLLAARAGGVRVYAVGVDTAVNEGFLRRLAGLGGGGCELVESEARLDEVMDRVHRRLGAPVLTDLTLEPAGLEVDRDTVAPARLPALFPGAPLLVGGRYRGRAGGALSLRGRDAAGRPWSATVPATVQANPALAAVWARAHLRDLEDRYAAAAEPDPGLERRIVDTSLRFGVLCRFTAFAAVDTRVANQGGRVHRVIQPVEPPAGWDMLAVRPMAAAMPLARMATAAGGVRPALARPGVLGTRPGPGPDLPERRPPTPLAGQELAAYRARAQQLAALIGGEAEPWTQSDLAALIDQAEVEPPGDLGLALGLLRVRLAALLSDLDSVGAAAAELRPLRELAADLDRLDADPAPGAAELAALRDRALAALAAFAGPEGSGEPRRGAPDDRGSGPGQPEARRGWWRRP